MNTRVSSVLFSMILLSQTPLANASQELAEAARIGDMYTVEKLLSAGGDPNDIGIFSTPVLHWVVHYGQLDTATLLLEAGADANLRNADTGITTLSLALDGNDTAMVKLLLEHGAEVDLPNAMGVTPLIAAGGFGSSRGVLAGRSGLLLSSRSETLSRRLPLWGR